MPARELVFPLMPLKLYSGRAEHRLSQPFSRIVGPISPWSNGTDTEGPQEGPVPENKVKECTVVFVMAPRDDSTDPALSFLAVVSSRTRFLSMFDTLP